MLAQETFASYTLGDYAEGYFEWDVAPMPQYRVYNDDGTLKEVNETPVTGKKATHSTLSCYAVSAYSTHKEEAWTFIEYLLSDDVQNEIADLGSPAGVPAVKSVANSDRYLNSTAQHTAKNKAVLLEAGIPEEQIAVTNLCTHCNPDILFSHRAQGDRRGNLSAFLALKE